MAAADGGQQLAVRKPGALAALQALSQLPVLRQMGVMAGIAVSVALAVWVVQWSWSPGYAVLYAGLPAKEASEVVAGLQRAGIAQRLDPQTGAVLVPADDVHRARLALAAEGLPNSADLGFEVLHREPDLGTSQFLEQARYQHALEVELARSVATLTSVEKARVHLALPRHSAFVRERKPPSASVLVHLYPGRNLEQSQVAAIAHLVAASVPGMEVGGVRIVDQKGRLLSLAEPSREAAFTQQEFDYARRLEGYYIKRIEDILAPVLGPEGVRAQVVADLDFTRTEQTRESFNPELSALRSEQVSEETRPGAGSVGGIPGALSNTPPAAGVAPERVVGAAGAAAGQEAGASTLSGAPGVASPSTSRRYTRNFEVDRLVSHTVMPSGNLRKLSVAVVLDDLKVVGANGETARRPLAQEELERFSGLVKEAVGFDPERGDSVHLVNVSFAGGTVEEAVAAPSIWQGSWLWTLGRQAVGVALVLVLALGVLRPAMRRLASQAAVLVPPALAGPRTQRAAESERLAEDRISLSDGQAGVARLSGRDRHQQQTESLRSVVSQDPKRVAQVVRNWISEDE